MVNVAILGATSHIAKWLIRHYAGLGARLYLFSRSATQLRARLPEELAGLCDASRCKIYDNYGKFAENQYDVIINCIGPGIVGDGYGDYTDYFVLTEKYDNLVIDYLTKHNRKALFICFSSGGVYGHGLTLPATNNTANQIFVNKIQPADYHSISKIYSESKHRAYSWLNIVDIRVFSYFSRYADLSEKYLLSEIVNAIASGDTFITGDDDIVRDFVHPDDLCQLVDKCVSLATVNASYDAYSRQPTTKLEILRRFSAEFGLKYEFGAPPARSGGTGYKPVYCSDYHTAATIGYQPEYTSIEALLAEARHLLAGRDLDVENV